MLHKHKQYRKKKKKVHEQIKKSSLGFSSIPLFISHSTSVCFSASLLQVPVGEYSSSSQISRIKPYHATTIPLADVLLSCKKLPRCGRGKEGGVRERERGRGRKEKEVRRRRKRGGSRPTSRRRRGDASKDTAALSLKSTKSRTRKKAKMEGGGGVQKQGNCGARSTLLCGMCEIFSPWFCIIAVFSCTTISYPATPTGKPGS